MCVHVGVLASKGIKNAMSSQSRISCILHSVYNSGDDKLLNQGDNSMAGEMSQWLKCFCASVKTRVWIHRNHVKTVLVCQPTKISADRRRRQGNSGASWLARPTKMVSSYSAREPASLGEVENN